VNHSHIPASSASSDSVFTSRLCASVSSLSSHSRGIHLIAFRLRCSRGEMYIGHARLYVCLPVPRRIPTLLYTNPDVTWGSGRVCPLVVHYWANLQSVHGFRCYENIAPNAKCQRVLVLALCLVNICCFTFRFRHCIT